MGAGVLYCSKCNKYKTKRQAYLYDSVHNKYLCRVCGYYLIRKNPIGCKSATLCNKLKKRCRVCQYYDPSELWRLKRLKAKSEERRPIMRYGLTTPERRYIIYQAGGVCQCCRQRKVKLELLARDNQVYAVVCNRCKRLLSTIERNKGIIAKALNLLNNPPLIK